MSKEVCLNIPANPIALGKLGSAHGIRGWLRIFSSTEYTEDIFDYQPWFIQRSCQWWQRLELEGWKQHNKDIIIKIKHIDDRNAANLITNYEIIIDSAQLPVLEDNEYYWKDLIGCQVITTKGYSFGFVQDLIETGSNDVLVIKANLKDAFGIKERLIPFLDEQIIKNIDLTTKIIEVDWNPCF
ncbi:MAG: ribosome maturation factor RimM [Arsenophonus sp. NEOnobi-MAG3]